MGRSVYHRGHLFYFRFKGTYQLFPDFNFFLQDPIWVLLKHFCRSLHLQRCSVREKGTVSQRFFWDIRKLNAFLYELFQNVSIARSVSRLQTVATLLTGNSTTYFFLTIFQSFRRSYFKTPHKIVCDGVYPQLGWAFQGFVLQLEG